MFAGMLGGLEIIVLACLALISFIFWVWMLIDCIQNRALSEGEKIGWTPVIVFTHALGALIYLLVGRKKAAEPVVR